MLALAYRSHRDIIKGRLNKIEAFLSVPFFVVNKNITKIYNDLIDIRKQLLELEFPVIEQNLQSLLLDEEKEPELNINDLLRRTDNLFYQVNIISDSVKSSSSDTKNHSDEVKQQETRNDGQLKNIKLEQSNDRSAVTLFFSASYPQHKKDKRTKQEPQEIDNGLLDLLIDILEYLPIRSRLVLSSVNKEWNRAVAESKIYEPFIPIKSVSDYGKIFANSSFLSESSQPPFFNVTNFRSKLKSEMISKKVLDHMISLRVYEEFNDYGCIPEHHRDKCKKYNRYFERLILIALTLMAIIGVIMWNKNLTIIGSSGMGVMLWYALCDCCPIDFLAEYLRRSYLTHQIRNVDVEIIKDAQSEFDDLESGNDSAPLQQQNPSAEDLLEEDQQNLQPNTQRCVIM